MALNVFLLITQDIFTTLNEMHSGQNNVGSRLIVSQSKCDERQFWYLSHPSTLFKDMYLPTMSFSVP